MSSVVGVILPSGMTAGVCAANTVTWDGRAARQRPKRGFSIRRCQFPIDEASSWFDEGWFRTQFLCNKISFDKIVEYITAYWENVNPPIKYNGLFFIEIESLCVYII